MDRQKLNQVINEVIFPKDIKQYYKIVTSLFILATLIGIFTGFVISQTLYNQILDKIFHRVTDNVNWETNFTIMLSIWKNNVNVGFLMYTFTIIGSILFTFIIVAINGFVLGFVLSHSLSIKSILLILPHGILEIPAIMLFGWAGVLINEATYRHYVKNEKLSKDEVITVVKNSIKYLIIGVALLLVSAFIEAYITIRISTIV